jgi:hypothetical protein
VDVVGLVVDLLEDQPLRPHEDAIDLRHDLANFVHHVQDVGARLLERVEREPRPALVPDEREGLAVAELDSPDVADVDRCAVDGLDDDVADVLRTAIVAGGADQIPSLALVEIAAGVVLVLGRERCRNLGHGDLANREGVGIDDHLHLALAAAVDVRLRHAPDAFETRLDLVIDPVEQRRDIGVVARRGGDHEPRHGVGVAVDGEQDRFLGVGGVLRYLLETVRDPDEDGVGVGSDRELHQNLAVPLVRLALHLQ